ncbi:hypothetical protein Efla_004123 [Eimeria flavescens]
MTWGDPQTPLAAPGAPGAPRLRPSLALEGPMQKKMRGAAKDLSVVQQTDKQQVSGLEKTQLDTLSVAALKAPGYSRCMPEKEAQAGEGVKQPPRSRSSSSHKAAGAAAQAATTR